MESRMTTPTSHTHLSMMVVIGVEMVVKFGVRSVLLVTWFTVVCASEVCCGIKYPLLLLHMCLVLLNQIWCDLFLYLQLLALLCGVLCLLQLQGVMCVCVCVCGVMCGGDVCVWGIMCGGDVCECVCVHECVHEGACFDHMQGWCVYDSRAHILNNSYQPPSASAPTPCCRPSSQMAQDLFVLCLKN